MYRLIFTLLLCAAAASGAPQDSSAAGDDARPAADDRRANATDAQGISDNAPSATVGAIALTNSEFVRRARQGAFTADEVDDADTTETAELAAERLTSPRTATASGRSFGRPRPTPPSARFVSKLGYFDKPGAAGGEATNLVENLGKDGRRKFESSCRCEKIWNCPKLQITTPRCPDEYFLCCFA